MYKLNRPISEKTEFVIINFTMRKTTGLGDFTVEFYQKLKKQIMPVLYTLFQKIGEQDNAF